MHGCGIYKCVTEYKIEVLPCGEASHATCNLCEYDEPVDVHNNKLAVGIDLPPVYSQSSNDSVFQLVSCPGGHMTHFFLACDVSSTCWATEEILAYDERDIPSHTSCPATSMTSRPPSFKCELGGGRVPYTWVCDHRQDCSDNSDEGFCRHLPCRELTPLQCGNTPQVRKDGENVYSIP